MNAPARRIHFTDALTIVLGDAPQGRSLTALFSLADECERLDLTAKTVAS